MNKINKFCTCTTTTEDIKENGHFFGCPALPIRLKQHNLSTELVNTLLDIEWEKLMELKVYLPDGTMKIDIKKGDIKNVAIKVLMEYLKITL